MTISMMNAATTENPAENTGAKTACEPAEASYTASNQLEHNGADPSGCHIQIYASIYAYVIMNLWHHQPVTYPSDLGLVNVQRLTPPDRIRLTHPLPSVTTKILDTAGLGSEKGLNRSNFCAEKGMPLAKLRLVGGWTSPSDKYESQLGWWHSQLNGKIGNVLNHQPA